jgi:hypothetical protein
VLVCKAEQEPVDRRLRGGDFMAGLDEPQLALVIDDVGIGGVT